VLQDNRKDRRKAIEENTTPFIVGGVVEEVGLYVVCATDCPVFLLLFRIHFPRVAGGAFCCGRRPFPWRSIPLYAYAYARIYTRVRERDRRERRSIIHEPQQAPE
jgi:hypothetical protein